MGRYGTELRRGKGKGKRMRVKELKQKVGNVLKDVEGRPTLFLTTDD